MDVEKLSKTIGANLTRIREEKGYTIDDVVEQVPIGKKTYIQYELARVLLGLKALIMLSDLFDVTLDEIVREH